MGFIDFFEKWFHTTQTVGGETIIIDIPASVFYKELALYTGTSLISNAIARSEMKVYKDRKPVKDEDYFLLNVSPNPNQTSSQFWHKVIKNVIREGEALAVEINGQIYCADSFSLEKEQALKGNTYSGITIDTYPVNKKFDATNIYHFHMNKAKVGALINGLYEEYGEVLSTAIKAFKRSNGQKYKIHIEGAQAGDDEFMAEFENVIKKQLKDFMENDNAIYPEFDGYSLEPAGKESARNSDDIIKLRKDMFQMVADALKIPQSLMSGNITNMNDIVKLFLTFAVDPYADMITEVLNKRAGIKNWMKGDYYKVDTSKIIHRDLFEIAPNAEKLISSGLLNIDEGRIEIGYDELGTDWSTQHWMTKNFAKIEELLAEILKGGEKQ